MTAGAFCRYAAARISRDVKDRVFRAYVTDALQVITENTAKYGAGRYIKARYADIIKPQPPETRTADEIINHFKKKLGGENAGAV